MPTRSRSGTARRTRDPEPASGGLGGVLRGSMTSVVGAAGLNMPLRAIERLTGAIEQATAILQRLERATAQLDTIDENLLDRVDESFDILARLGDDTAVMRERIEDLERDVRELLAVTRGEPAPRARRRRT